MSDLDSSTLGSGDTGATQDVTPTQDVITPTTQEPSAPENWRTSLPEDWRIKVKDEIGQDMEIKLRDHPVLGKYGSKDEAVKALVHAQALLGQKGQGLVKPGADAKPEELAAYFNALGRPETADKYEVPKVDGLPDGFALPTELDKGIRDTLHGLGLSQEQFAGAYKALLTDAAQGAQKQAEAREAHRISEFDAFKAEHGAKAEETLKLAQKGAQAVGGDEFIKALAETGAGNHRVVLNALAKIGASMGEGGMKTGEQIPGLTQETLNEWMRDPRYIDPARRDAAFVAKVENGFKQLYPGDYKTPGTGQG